MAKSERSSRFGLFERIIAMRYLGARKKEGGIGLIAIISFFCIMLAVAAMIIIMSIMNGFRANLLDKLLGIDGHIYVESVQSTPTPEDINTLLQRIRSYPDVETAFPISNNPTFATTPGQGAPALVVGMTPEDMKGTDFISQSLVSGDLDAFGQGRKGGNYIAMGARLAASLNLRVGDYVSLISVNRRSTVIGGSLPQKNYQIIATFHVGYFLADSTYIYMPLEQAQLFFSRGAVARNIQVRLDDPDKIDNVSPDMKKALGPVFFEDWRDKNQSIAGALKVEQVAMRLILMIVVVISVFPVISAMIMLVKNKGRDIGILRTIGASRGSILRIFFMSGATIGILGTLAGLIIGIIFCLNVGAIQTFLEWITGNTVFDPEVYQLSRVPAKIEWGEVLVVTLWGILISSVATFFPALSASKTDPVEALRYE